MSDDLLNRDRQIRAAALNAAAVVVAGGVSKTLSLGVLSHSYAHFIHAGIWITGNECEYGDKCRFGGAS